VEAKEQVIRF